MRKLITICLMTVLFNTGYVKAFIVVSQYITPDFLNQRFDFKITFDQVPDFYTFDSVGRQADSFQYMFDADCKSPFNRSSDTDICVRGEEIHSLGYIPVRNKSLSNEPGCGGWGGIVDMVPFVLDGKTLTFSAGFALIAPNGQSSYLLETYEYGTNSGKSYSIWGTTPIPEPATLLLLGFGALALRRKR
jgi:hypothetical protein